MHSACIPFWTLLNLPNLSEPDNYFHMQENLKKKKKRCNVVELKGPTYTSLARERKNKGSWSVSPFAVSGANSDDGEWCRKTSVAYQMALWPADLLKSLTYILHNSNCGSIFSAMKNTKFWWYYNYSMPNYWPARDHRKGSLCWLVAARGKLFKLFQS